MTQGHEWVKAIGKRMPRRLVWCTVATNSQFVITTTTKCNLQGAIKWGSTKCGMPVATVLFVKCKSYHFTLFHNIWLLRTLRINYTSYLFIPWNPEPPRLDQVFSPMSLFNILFFRHSICSIVVEHLFFIFFPLKLFLPLFLFKKIFYF